MRGGEKTEMREKKESVSQSGTHYCPQQKAWRNISVLQALQDYIKPHRVWMLFDREFLQVEKVLVLVEDSSMSFGLGISSKLFSKEHKTLQGTYQRQSQRYMGLIPLKAVLYGNPRTRGPIPLRMGHHLPSVSKAQTRVL